MAVFELRSTKGLGTLRIDQPWVRVGRAADNTLVTSDPTVSRYHLNLYIKDDLLICEDAGSQNGFLVNGTPTKAATTLSPGDRLYFGSLEYIVVRPDRAGMIAPPNPTPTFNAGGQPVYTATAAMGSSSGPDNSGRMKLYGGLGIVLALVAVFANQEEKKDARKNSEIVQDLANEDLKAMTDEGFRPETRPPKSLTEITAEGKLREGLRELDNENYVRALLAFEEARTNNPSMDEIDSYIQEAQGSLNAQLSKFRESSDVSFSRFQFQRSKSEALQILTILAERIPGYARKLASESVSKAGDPGRPPIQEEILMKIPCDKLPKSEGEEAPAQTAPVANAEEVRKRGPLDYAAMCTAALKRISDTRKRLGEEDSLR